MASERRRRTLFVALAALVAAGTLVYLATGGIGENLVYYWSPSELRQAGDDAVGASVRLGGLVESGSVVRGDNLRLEFAVTDGSSSVPVRAETVPPAMFREGIGVVVEGTLGSDGTFETRRLMVKHDNEYRAPEAGETPDVERLVETLAPESAGG